MDSLHYGVAVSIFVWLVVCQPVAPLGYCPKGWIKHGRKCYVMIRPVSGSQTSNKASQVCRDHGGELMDPQTEELVNMATVLIRSQGADDAFVGLNDRDEEGDYRWGDGSKARGLKWSKGEPNNDHGLGDCGNMYVSGEFNDLPCDKSVAGLSACQKTAEEQIVVPPQKGKNCKGKKKPNGRDTEL